MTLRNAIFVSNLASTLFMAGVIWFVQVVHYPLFAAVGRSSFAGYELEHVGRTTWIVAMPMIIEAVTAIAKLWLRPNGISNLVVWSGLSLVLIIWLSTFAFQVPLHGDLREGFDALSHRNLVISNWIRTGAWSARALLVLTTIPRIE